MKLLIQNVRKKYSQILFIAAVIVLCICAITLFIRGSIVQPTALTACVLTVCVAWLAQKRKCTAGDFVQQLQKVLLENYGALEAVETVLERIGKKAGAQFVFLFETDEKNEFICKYAWKCGENTYESLSNTEQRLLLQELIPENITGVTWTPNALRQKGKQKPAEIMSRHGIGNMVITKIADALQPGFFVMEMINVKRCPKDMGLFYSATVILSAALKNMAYLQEMEKRSRYDELTGLLNRHCYQQTIKKYKADNIKNVNCIYIDINGLRAMNNTLGHEAGDEMLSSVAMILKEQFSEENIYRIGGDEFIVFCEDERYETILQKVNAVEDRITRNGYSAAIGVSCSKDKKLIDDLIKSAEKNMYETKRVYYLEKGGGNKA